MTEKHNVTNEDLKSGARMVISNPTEATYIAASIYHGVKQISDTAQFIPADSGVVIYEADLIIQGKPYTISMTPTEA